ncbi:MFS transporter [Pseudoduganella sp. CY13W]|uniref:MFS transporter n=2 Tax=Duganella qianjiadongensis TaxID=2692176 RepID=A0ABW9VE33_9BURK|nr:MFS transporter [Duganella qianjiadongensis]
MAIVPQWLAQPRHYQRFVLCIAGLGGLLYGIDVGIIAGALPYLEASAAARWGLTAQQLGLVVAAVLLGSVLSSLAAGALADRFGRLPVMVLAGALFSLSIPVIALADAYLPLLLGRLLQGISGGLIGVVVPLYLAECLPADQRGRGTGLFQLLLTLGLVLAALLGLLVAQQIDQLAGQASALVIAAKDRAWRQIFWLSLPPGLLFTGGACLLAESPRWLLQRAGGPAEQTHQRAQAAALAALCRSAAPAQAQVQLAAMLQQTPAQAQQGRGSLLQWQYAAPFLLACSILALNQASGINSILAYSVTILDQAGLPGALANSGDVLLKLVNALMTVLAVLLVDRKGRKFLLTLGSAGMALALLAAGLLFAAQESGQQDVRPALAQAVQGRSLQLGSAQLAALVPAGDWQLTLAYSYGPYKATRQLRGAGGNIAGVGLALAPPVQLEGDSVIGAAFRRLHLNPFPDLALAQQAPLLLERATLGSLPAQRHGWLMLGCLLLFIASFAVGPGVCVWLALSELMPTRIRSNGMSVALLINQFVSTAIAAVFLPTVVQFGYAPMFYSWAACALLYFLVAALLLPETRGKTLEEISLHFRLARDKPAEAAQPGGVPE